MVLSLFWVGLAVAQTTHIEPADRLGSEVEALYFIYLDEGNVWEYAISNEKDGYSISPSYLRFTIESHRRVRAEVHDYTVRTDVYDETQKIRQTRCVFRRMRGKVHLVGMSSIAGFSDCNYQSPMSQQDVEIAEGPVSIDVGGSDYSATSLGTYQHFWSNQTGDGGYISFKYASDLGLYSFESHTNASPSESDLTDGVWLGTLIYAKVAGVVFGESDVSAKYNPVDLAPGLSPVH